MIDALSAQGQGSRTAIIALGEATVGAGQIAASLILREVCCQSEVKTPPAQILVFPDCLSTRDGYLQLQITPIDMRNLMNAWRLRAVGAGKSPGDLTQVERALSRRMQREPSALRKRGAENLHLFFPAYRFIDNNTIATVASRDHLRASDAPPAVMFADVMHSGANLHDWNIEPDWVIIDCAAARNQLDIETILTITNAFPYTRLLCLVHGLSDRLIDQLPGRGFALCLLRDTRESEVDYPKNRIVCESVGSAIVEDDLRRLLDLLVDGRRSLNATSGSIEWAAFNLLRTAVLLITSLPTERAYYDSAAVERFGVPTTEEILTSLRDFESRVAMSCPPLGAAIEEARSILTYSMTTIDANNDRNQHLRTTVENAIAGTSGLCVVVRNRTMRAAVEASLTDVFQTDVSDLNATGIRVECRRDLQKRSLPEGMAVLWINYGGLEDLDTMLGFETRQTTMLLNHIERALLTNDLRTWTRRARGAIAGTEAIGVKASGWRMRLTNSATLIGQAENTVDTNQGVDLDADLSRILEEASLARAVDVRAENVGAMRPAISVVFQSGTQSFFPEHGLVTIFRGNDEHPTEVSVRDLRVGDCVVFIDRSIGKTIYELMQEQLTQSPLVGAAAQVVSVWHRAISLACVQRGISIQEIHRELRQLGSSITTLQTIRYWLRGGVLGPRDIQDVNRLATVLRIGQRNTSVLEEIKTSIRGLRIVYRQFAKIVYKTILTGATGRVLSDSEQRLIEDHGITMADLRGAVTTDVIAYINPTIEPRPAIIIGRRDQ